MHEWDVPLGESGQALVYPLGLKTVESLLDRYSLAQNRPNNPSLFIFPGKMLCRARSLGPIGAVGHSEFQGGVFRLREFP
jgi:hypothetical protein